METLCFKHFTHLQTFNEPFNYLQLLQQHFRWRHLRPTLLLNEQTGYFQHLKSESPQLRFLKFSLKLFLEAMPENVLFISEHSVLLSVLLQDGAKMSTVSQKLHKYFTR